MLRIPKHRLRFAQPVLRGHILATQVLGVRRSLIADVGQASDLPDAGLGLIVHDASNSLSRASVARDIRSSLPPRSGWFSFAAIRYRSSTSPRDPGEATASS